MKMAIVLLALVVAGLLAWLAASPIEDVAGNALRRHPSYDQAVLQIRNAIANEPAVVLPECRSIILEHGRRTGRVILFFHGITNCPMQFMQLGQRLYESGANVYIPRIPHHGFTDRMTTDLANLEAQEMASFADQALELASGLGDTVVVSGLSLGGVLSAYLAQEREEVGLAVPIAPLLGPAMAPAWLARPLTRVALVAPNGFQWWDAKRRESLPGPGRVYPRFATRAMAEIMRLGAIVEDRAARRSPAARRIVMVTVGKDPAVSNAAVASLVRAWQAHAPDRVQAYEFPESLRLGHDVIDPDQPYQRVGVVYPILENLLLGGEPR